MPQPFSSFSLSGRCALLTGATGYLGASMAYALAKAGAKVLVNSRSREKAQSLVAQLLAEGYDAEPLVFDLASPEQVYEAISTLNGQPLHILINNAYEGQGGTIESADAFQYQDSYELVVSSAHRILKSCLPSLRIAVADEGDASVVNIASMYGMVSPDLRVYDTPQSANPPFYGAAKAALIQWTRYAACEFGNEAIRVNCISPGPFPSKVVQLKKPKFVESLSHRTPLGRVGKAEELQGPLLFLASKASSYVTGCNLVVDGGWTAW